MGADSRPAAASRAVARLHLHTFSGAQFRPECYPVNNPTARSFLPKGKGQRVILRKRLAQFLALACAALVTAPARASERDRRWTHSMAAGQLAYEAGRFNEAESLLKGALANAEKFGPRDPRLSSTLNRLAQVYHDQGKYSQAEPLYKRSLTLTQKALGPAHPDVAANINNLATLYRDEGRYDRAEALYKQSLHIVRKALGPASPDVAIGLNNLAELYSDEGKYTDAEPLYKQSLQIWEKTQGPNDFSVAISLNNLGTLYDNQKKYDEAEKLYKRALAIKEINLGGSDPSVALSLSNLGKVYIAQGNFDDAQPALYRALTILHWPTEQSSNPVVGRALNHLATFYREKGNYELSEYYYKKSLETTRKAQGSDSPNMARTMTAYAVMLRETHRPSEAAKMESDARAIEASSLHARKPPAHRKTSRKTRRAPHR